MTEIEAFERWFGPNAAEGCWAKRDIWDTDQYQSPYTQTAWLAWQASRQQALEEAASLNERAAATFGEPVVQEAFIRRALMAVAESIRSLKSVSAGSR